MKIETDQRLKQKNIKPTAMRELVYEVLAKQKKALSLYEIEQQFDNVDRSTIFRTLKTFQDKYLIHSIDDGSGAVKYAMCDDDCSCNIEDLHIHFYCIKCGQTSCMKNMPVPKMDLPDGFAYKSFNYVVKGTCPDCH